MKPSTYLRFLRWLAQFEVWPRYNRFGAGMYQLLWSHYCGHDWRFAWKMAWCYWSPK